MIDEITTRVDLADGDSFVLLGTGWRLRPRGDGSVLAVHPDYTPRLVGPGANERLIDFTDVRTVEQMTLIAEARRFMASEGGEG